MANEAVNERSTDVAANDPRLSSSGESVSRPSNVSLAVELNGCFMDALEAYIRHDAHSTLVAAGLAKEKYFGQARVTAEAHAYSLAIWLTAKVRALNPEGAIAEALAVLEAASAEFKRSEQCLALDRDPASPSE